MNLQWSCVVLSDSTHQYSVGTTPLWVEALGLGFQERPTADDESGLIMEPTMQNISSDATFICNFYSQNYA